MLVHLAKLNKAGHAEAEVVQIVGSILIENEAVMPIVHPKIATPRLSLVCHFKTQNFGRIVLPCVNALHPEPHIAKLRHLNHFAASPFSPSVNASGERSFANRYIFNVGIEIEAPAPAFAAHAGILRTAEGHGKIADKEAVDP